MKPTKSRWLITLITLAAMAFRLHHLGSQSLWFDEAFSWACASVPLPLGMRFALENFVHPPLYYLLLRPFAALSQSEFSLRLLSAWVGVISVPLTYALGRRLLGERAAIAAAIVLSANMFHIWYSQEARMYALLFLVSLGMGFSFHKVVKSSKPKHWVELGLWSAIGYVTHYFSLLIGLSQAVFILLDFKKRYSLLRPWALTQAVASMPLGLWLYGLYLQPQKAIGVGWIPRPSALDPFLTLWNFSTGVCISPMCPYLALFFPFAVAMLLALSRWRELQWLLTWLFFPIIFVWLISVLLPRHFYVDRFFMVSFPAYILLVGAGVATIQNTALRRLLLSVLVLSSVAGGFRVYFDPSLRKDARREALGLVGANASPGDVIALGQTEEVLMIKYYGPPLPLAFLDQRPLGTVWEAMGKGHRLWVVLKDTGAWAHSPIRPQANLARRFPREVQWLREHHREIVTHRSFTGLEVFGLRKP